MQHASDGRALAYGTAAQSYSARSGARRTADPAPPRGRHRRQLPAGANCTRRFGRVCDRELPAGATFGPATRNA